jgi:hypothetical protein
MRLRLGSVNLALLSIYFVPIWGGDALRTLMSPYHGLENVVHAASAAQVRRLLGLGYEGLVLTSHMLAGIKLVIAAAFVAYAIEFARACAMRRDADRETVDVVLTLAVIGIGIWALPALALNDGVLVRIYAAQVLLVMGAVFVVVIERHVDTANVSRPSPVEAAGRERQTTALPMGMLARGPIPEDAAVAVASIPEARLRYPSSA